MPDSSARISLLYIGLNASAHASLRLTRENDAIAALLANDRRFALQSRWNVATTDLARLLRESGPALVHISGHGSDDGWLVFEDEQGSYEAKPEQLAEVFEHARSRVRCVVLNACYTEPLAKLIAAHVDFVIGMRGSISDSDALGFTKGFYGELKRGLGVRAAFDAARLHLSVSREGSRDLLCLYVHPDAREGPLSPATVPAAEAPAYVYVSHAPGDKLAVLRLCRDLIAVGVRPWLDMWQLDAKADHAAGRRGALQGAPAVIVCEGPAGSGAEREAELLAARMGEGVPVLRVVLPGDARRSKLCEGLPGVELDERRWVEGVRDLAELIGPDADPESWGRHAAGPGGELPEPYRGLEGPAGC